MFGNKFVLVSLVSTILLTIVFPVSASGAPAPQGGGIIGPLTPGSDGGCYLPGGWLPRQCWACYQQNIFWSQVTCPGGEPEPEEEVIVATVVSPTIAVVVDPPFVGTDSCKCWGGSAVIGDGEKTCGTDGYWVECHCATFPPETGGWKFTVVPCRVADVVWNYQIQPNDTLPLPSENHPTDAELVTAEQAVADWWHNGRMPTVELLSSAEMYRVETLLESGDFDIGELNFQADSDSIQAIASVPHNTQADDIFVVTLNEVLPHWQMIADSLEWVGPAVTNEVAVAAHWPAHLVQEQGMSLSAAANLLQNGIQAAFGGAEGSRFIFRQAGNGYQEAVYAVFKWQDRIVITVLNPENGAPITAFARRTSKAVSYMKSVSVRETTEILDPSDPRLSEVRRVWQGRPNIWRFFVWVVKGKLLAVQIGVTMWVEAATAFTAPSTELFFILGYIPRTEWVEEDTLG